jgi:hypothetical protein
VGGPPAHKQRRRQPRVPRHYHDIKLTHVIAAARADVVLAAMFRKAPADELTARLPPKQCQPGGHHRITQTCEPRDAGSLRRTVPGFPSGDTAAIVVTPQSA